MLIVAAGMMRSASTWQYQVACELASLAGPATFLGYLERDEFTNEFDRITAEEGIFVVKMHPHHELVADLAQKGRAKILYTFRDVRDVLYSTAHKLMISPRQAIDWYLPADIEAHRFWMSCTNRFAMRYEDFVADSLGELNRIAEFLDISVAPGYLAELDRRYSPDANRERANLKRQELQQEGCNLLDAKYACLRDHVELVHWNHMRNGEIQAWRKVATKEELTLLGSLCGDWLVDNGYEINRDWVVQAAAGTGNTGASSQTAPASSLPIRSKVVGGAFKSWHEDVPKPSAEQSNKPSISVIVPTCGRVSLFKETLDSLAQQTCHNFEVVVTDDSPQEEDRRLIRGAVEKFALSSGHRAKYVHSTPRLGQAVNTNQGLLAASGDLLRILHSDDLLRRDALEREAALFALESQVDVLFEDCIPFTQEVVFDREPQAAFINPAHHLRNELSHSTALPSGLVFRRQVVERAGLMNEQLRFLCDWEFFYRLLLDQISQRKLVGRLTAGLFGWRTHVDSVTKTLWKVHFEEHERFIEEILASKELDDLGAFSSNEKKQFADRALRYRYDRLWNDFQQLAWSDRWHSRTWMLRQFRGRGKRLLSKHLTKALERSVRHRVRGPKSRKQPAPLDPVIADAKLRTYRTLPENTGKLAIMPFFDASIVATHAKSLLVDYDNSIHLWPHREQIARAQSLRLFFVNYNRMYERVLHEALKYVAVDQEVEILLGGNDHLQWFGLKAAVDLLFPAQFELTDQENIAGDFYSIKFRRRQPAPSHLCEEHTGWTFGLLTLGGDKDRVLRYVRSIEEAHPANYEVLVVSPRKLSYLDDAKNVRQIIFSDRDDLGWITRKKNLICQAANFTDILICHDRFELTPKFFSDWNAWGYSYGMAAPRVKLRDGRRGLDWSVASSRNHTWSHGGLLDYRSYSPYVYVPGGATAVRKSFWERFPWNENLYWNEHEDVELCRRAQRHGEIISLASATLITASDRWIDQNPLLPFDPYCEKLFGGPVGEQRINYLEKPAPAA